MDENFFVISKSAVNFCKPDMFICGIGEIWNVLSSFGIVFFGLYGLYNINYKFAIEDNVLIDTMKTKTNILYSLLGLIGLGSVYFHTYLSPFAHWVDITFISIILVFSQYILSNPVNFSKKIKYFGIMLGHFTTSIYIPQIHIFLLFASGFAIKNLIEHKIDIEASKINSSISNNLVQTYWWIKKYFMIALLFWIIDYFGCSFINPYHTHWIFHIFIGLVSYKIIGILKYLDY